MIKEELWERYIVKDTVVVPVVKYVLAKNE